MSCTVTDNSKKILVEKSIDKDTGYFKKRDIQISSIDEYDIDFKVSEKFYVSKDLSGMSISHISLPIPSVVKVA